MHQTSIRWVIKFGGSLTRSCHLTEWLCELSQTHAVIVPGGGPFADAVRLAQSHWRFDDKTAHAMAILGMQQYGRLLAGLCPDLQKLTEPCQLQQAANQPSVWLPEPETLERADIPADWNMTSDSIAAWLAGQIGFHHLLLVKSVPELDLPQADSHECSMEDAVAMGWIDPLFPVFARPRLSCWLCGPAGWHRLLEGLASPRGVFRGLH